MRFPTQRRAKTTLMGIRYIHTLRGVCVHMLTRMHAHTLKYKGHQIPADVELLTTPSAVVKYWTDWRHPSNRPGLTHSRDARPSLVRAKCCIRSVWLVQRQHIFPSVFSISWIPCVVFSLCARLLVALWLTQQPQHVVGLANTPKKTC